MLVRLTDFAEQNRITNRTVQIHIKENTEILEGHVERRGKQGTWLDDFAVAFLLDKIQLPTKDEVIVPTPREAALLIQLSEANARWAAAEARAAEYAEVAGKVKLLEDQSRSFQDENVELQREIFELKADQMKHKQETDILEGFIQDAKAEIDVLKKEKDDQKRASDQKIEDLRRQLEEEKKKSWVQKLFGR